MTTVAIEETAEMYRFRRDRNLHMGIGLMMFVWVGVGLLHLTNEVVRRYTPEAFPLGPAGALVLSIIVGGFLVGWAASIEVVLKACRAAPVRIGPEGIEMPTLPFRNWLRGDQVHKVSWDRVRLDKLIRLPRGRWGIVLSDGLSKRYGLAGGWFGPEAAAALEEIQVRLAMRGPRAQPRKTLSEE